MIEVWAALFGALLYRFRGHNWGIGTQANRVIAAHGFGLIFLCASMDRLNIACTGSAPACAVVIWWAYALIAAVFSTFCWLSFMPGHGAHQRMHKQVYDQHFETTEALTFWLPQLFGPWRQSWDDSLKHTYQMLGMSFIGLVRHALMAVPLAAFTNGFDWKLFLCMGLLHGPAYFIGWRVTDDWHKAWKKWPLPFRSGNDFGELLTGALIGLSLVVSL